jgi:hypothetical protein
MKTIDYRGYAIVVRSAGMWSSLVYAPGSRLAMSQGTLSATLEEGEAVLLQRAKDAVDRNIEANS